MSFRTGLVGLIFIGLVGYTPPNSTVPFKAQFKRPTEVPFLETNPYSEAKVHLGKTLFFDPRLSSSNMLACASCHNPSLSWTDGNPTAIGDSHKVLPRKTPTLLNVAWGSTFFWDGRADSLEKQALGPISGAGEMNMPLSELPGKLAQIDGYAPLFSAAFGDESISMDRITKAIATYERTIISKEAAFDRWVAGEEDAISAEAKRGFTVFNTKANCISCHTGWRFTNGSFADIGLDSKDQGKGRFLFKTPTLRNISVRAPYMHDGSLKTLGEVVEAYNKGGTVQRDLTKLFIKPLNLTESEKSDLISFLETLTSEDEAVAAPSLPRVTTKGKTWRASERQLASEH